ncbi:MAG: RrF2 family transcriptional regulator [Planctomycetota bacterium]|jgi:Rrf2 family protein
MKVSTRSRYGLRALVELAREFGKGPVFMETIAKRQDLSRKYLHALLTRLKTEGLVESKRGAQGGYHLARPPEEIRLNDVFRALEGTLAILDCVEDEGACDRSETCRARDVWSGLTGTIEDYLAGMTLADLLAEGAPGTRHQRRKRG